MEISILTDTLLHQLHYPNGGELGRVDSLSDKAGNSEISSTCLSFAISSSETASRRIQALNIQFPIVQRKLNRERGFVMDRKSRGGCNCTILWGKMIGIDRSVSAIRNWLVDRFA